MRVLVTGAAGFVGGHLLQRLLAEHRDEVFAGVRNAAEERLVRERNGQLCVVPADLTDAGQVADMIRSVRPEGIIHLAAQSSVAQSFEEPEETMRVNVGGTAHLLESVADAGLRPRILLIGSADQYGNVPKERQPISEQEPLVPQSPYGESKVLQEQLAAKYRREYGLDCVIVRAGPHTGPYQSERFVIADWCAQMFRMKEEHREHTLSVGNLRVVRDITDVRDVVSAYCKLLHAGRLRDVYNVGTGKGICLEEVPKLIASCAGINDLRVVVDPKRCRPADIECLIVDGSRLRRDTGWEPKYTFRQTVWDMLEHLALKRHVSYDKIKYQCEEDKR